MALKSISLIFFAEISAGGLVGLEKKTENKLANANVCCLLLHLNFENFRGMILRDPISC